MLGSTNFWFGVLVGVALLWSWRKFGAGRMSGGGQQGQ